MIRLVRVHILCSLVLLLSFVLSLARTVDELEDSVDALEKEYFQKLKAVQDLKGERDFLEKKIHYRKEEIKELAQDRLQLVQEKKQKESSIETLKYRLEVEDSSEIDELEKTFDKLSHTLEEMEIEYRNTLLHLEKLKLSVKNGNEKTLLRVLDRFSPCHFNLSISNIAFFSKVLLNACEEISRIFSSFLGFFIPQENWLNFLQALFKLWLILFFFILYIILMRWCLRKLANDTIIAFGSELLLILVIFDWFAALVEVQSSKALLSTTLISWLICFLLFLRFLNGLQKFPQGTSFAKQYSAFFNVIGRLTLLYSFIYSCGRFPTEILAKISWISLLLLDGGDKQLRIFTSLRNLVRIVFLRICSSSNGDVHFPIFFNQSWFGARHKRRL
ncbi:hypothetical protein GpartN1_g774.t1 [Galdieria partita]|uniref:Uncharacterized protein n=1 Tax=Galdieria partita TaxID=83374 RepID=A0A9C7PQW0_9RHOD|nr:hypothetical protein GpartN1_g774.t1 [Galdieria partita]